MPENVSCFDFSVLLFSYCYSVCAPRVVCFPCLSHMTIEFILLVNKQGQTRLSEYYRFLPMEERVTLEGEVVRKCLQRNESDCNFMDHLQYRIVYRRYASLFFIVGVQSPSTLVVTQESLRSGGADNENELAILEFIHALVETLGTYFENVCELDVMFNAPKVHFILQEMVSNGVVAETNQRSVLHPLLLMDRN